MQEKRNKAAEKLIRDMPKYLYSLEKDQKVDKDDIEQIRQLKHALRSDNVLPIDLLQFRSLFTKYAKFQYFTPQ